MDAIDKGMMEDLKRKLSLAEQTKEALKERVEELLAERDKIQLELYFEQEKKGTAVKERDEAQKKVEDLQTQIESWKLKYTNLKLEESNAKWQASRIHERFIETYDKLKEVELEMEKMEQTVEAERDIRMDAQRNERNWREERDILLKENKTLRNKLETTVAVKRMLDVEYNSLTDEVNRISKTRDSLKEDLEFEKARFHEANIEREAAVKDAQDWCKECDILLKENGTLHKELEKMAVENHALNAQCDHLTGELLRITKAHDELQKEEFKRRVNELFGQAKKEQPVFFTADSDAVNHPSHYTKGGIECIEAIKASMNPEAFKGYLKGNSIKYLWRYKEKGYPLQDLEKAVWYTKRLIDEEGE